MLSLLIAAMLATVEPLPACLDDAPGAGNGRPHSLEIHLRIEEPTFVVQGVYRATRDGQMRIDIFADGQRVFAEALHDGVAREWSPGAGVQAVGAQATAALRHGIELPGRFFSFAEMAGRGHRVEAMGNELIDGAEHAVLQVTLDDGHAKRYWLDTDSCRVTRSRDVRAFHPSSDATKVTIETRALNYREQEGLPFAFRTENWNVDDDAWLGTTEVTELQVDPDLSETRFDLGDLAEG